jgi:hypothetical protein
MLAAHGGDQDRQWPATGMAMDRQHPARAVKYSGGAAGYQLAELACLVGTVAGERAAHTTQAIAGCD